MAAGGVSISTSSSSFPSRGHLIIKSHKPLPIFACAIPVPHPDLPVSQLRSTIVAILTGQVSASGKDESAGTSKNAHGIKSSASNSNGTTAGTNGQALSYSEHLKQITIHEWRLKSVLLELRQNALIAPETRNSVVEGEVEESREMSGFELQDDHECALLEHGDEVNLWLKSGQDIDSLRLPKLSSRHVYGLPNQPLLDRSGTLLLGHPPSYSSSMQSDFTIASPSAVVREPAEPSSHSSSVSAHPDVQFETTTRHLPISNQHRVVVVGASNGNGYANPAPLGTGIGGAANGSKQVRKEKPRRLNSAGYFSPQLIEQKLTERKQREKISHHRSYSGPTQQQASATSSSVVSPPPPILIPSPSHSPAMVSSPTMTTSPIASPPATTNENSISSQLKARQASFSKAEKQEKEKIRRAGMKKMPSDALIVGPGVQGKYGRMPSFDSRDKSNPGEEQGGGTGDSFGNLDAFVSFTAASSETHQHIRPHVGRMRRPSSRSSKSEKGESVEVRRLRDGKRPQKTDRRESNSSVTKRADTITNFNNSRPATATELLLPMPMPRPITSSSSPSNSWQEVLRPLDEIGREIATPYTTTPSTDSIKKETTNTVPTSSSSSSPAAAEQIAAITPSLDSSISPEPVKSLSKAERRYQEVMKGLEAEREKQRQNEQHRREAAIRREEEKAKAMAKLVAEQRQKKEQLKWQVWEEVRVRQAKEKERGS